MCSRFTDPLPPHRYQPVQHIWPDVSKPAYVTYPRKRGKVYSDSMNRKAELEITPQEFRRLGHRLVDQIAEHLGGMPVRPVSPDATPTAVRSALRADRGLPEEGSDPEALLESAAELLFKYSVRSDHPRFLGYISSSPAPIGVLGELLATALNQNCSGWTLAPMATEIEAQTLRWIAEFVGFPTWCGGLLMSGGNMANFVCFLAARTAKAGRDVRRAGLDSLKRRLVVYASVETHTWIEKAADLSGLGTDAIRWIAVDERRRMNTAELRRQIAVDRARNERPFLVVGTAGSVGTGTVDPLREIASICREFDLWFHVDGAYGAFAVAVPDAPDDLRALAMADSLAVDPHKWLSAPLEAGCALVRQPEHLRNTFSYRPSDYAVREEVLNFVDYGLQNSRGFRALKVWLALQHVGRRGYVATITENIRLSRKLHDLLQSCPDFEVLTQGLSITTFRYVPRDLRSRLGDPDTEERLNQVNRNLLERVVKGGEAFFSNAVIDDKFALRACIVNFRTSDEDIEALPTLVAELGRTVA